jgi:hypothetical protein
MKFRYAFFLSAVCNVGFAVLLISRIKDPASPGVNIAFVPPAASNAVTPSRTEKVVQLDWQSVESADYKEYIRNLRAIGCPEETVFDIIVADVNTLYAMKGRSLVPGREWKYWVAESDVPTREEIRNQKLRRELEQEKQALIAEILGPDAIERLKKYQLWGGEDLADRKLAFLPAEKRAQIKALQEKYFDARMAASEWAANGVMTEETMAKLSELEKQQRAEMEALLTPAELEDYDLRTSETANRLRRELAGAHPTEQEFRTLYQLRKGYEESMHAHHDVRDPLALQARIDVQNQLQERARRELGEGRYSEFLRSQDIDYQNTLQMVQFFGLPETAAADAYALKNQDAAAAMQISDNSNLTEDQRNQLFAELEREAETRLRQLLGDRVFEEYRRNNRWWMRGQ